MNMYVPLEAIDENNSIDSTILIESFRRQNSTALILVLIKLNLLTSNFYTQSQSEIQKEALNLLVLDQYLDRQAVIKIIKYMNAFGSKALPINRAGLLEAIRWTSVYGNDQASLIPTSNRKNGFVRILLACNDLYGAREISPTTLPGASKEENRETFLIGARRAATWGGAQIDPLVSLGRTNLLLNRYFLNGHPNYRSRFESLFKMSIEEWLTCYAAIIMCSLDPFNQAATKGTLDGTFEFTPERLTQQTPHLGPALERFLELLSQSTAELKRYFADCSLDSKQAFNFKGLRDRPILKLKGGRYIVIDRQYFVESMWAGPIFRLKETEGNKVFQAYGEAFKQYTFELLLKTNLAQQSADICPNLICEPTAKPMPLNDILLGDFKLCALFEVKGSWANDALLNEQTDIKFREDILKKYARPSSLTADGTKIAAKGMGQLVDVIKLLAAGGMKKIERNAEFVRSVEEIIPVLVVNDRLVAEPLMHMTLSNSFVDILGAEFLSNGTCKVGNILVHKPIILTIFDLEFMERFQLNESITTSFKLFSESWPERLYSFSTYLRDRHKDFTLRAADDQLARGSAIEVCNMIQRNNFSAKTK